MVVKDFSSVQEIGVKNFLVCMVVSVGLEGTVDVRGMLGARKIRQVVEVLGEVVGVV